MGEGSGGWWRGCLLGCAVLTTIPVLVLGIVTVRTCAPLRSAGIAQRQLEARFGRPGAFTPSPDGVVEAERIRAFLRIREAMTLGCRELQSMQGGIQDLENIEQRQGPSIGDVADGTLALGDLAMNITPWVGRFFENRNRALLDADMGLGEYSFLYLAAYRERFLDGSLDGELFCEGTVLSIEVGDDGTPPPWREVVRGSTTESLAPYRDRLDSLFCPATACIELDPDSRRAMALALE